MKKDTELNMRMNSEEKSSWQKAADIIKETLSEFIRIAVNKETKRVNSKIK
jgi:uncharacterized protein (DUF1778 family)